MALTGTGAANVPAAAKKFQLLFSQIEGTDTPTEDTWYQFGQLSIRDVT